jgi:hypothetical protein
VITRAQFLDFATARNQATGAAVWMTASRLMGQGVVRPEQVSRETMPGLSPHTLGVYRNALRRVQEAEAALGGAA